MLRTVALFGLFLAASISGAKAATIVTEDFSFGYNKFGTGITLIPFSSTLGTATAAWIDYTDTFKQTYQVGPFVHQDIPYSANSSTVLQLSNYTIPLLQTYSKNGTATGACFVNDIYCTLTAQLSDHIDLSQSTIDKWINSSKDISLYGGGYVDWSGGRAVDSTFNITGKLTVVFGAVPEPASWAMMMVGFGAVGGLMRRRQPTFA